MRFRSTWRRRKIGRSRDANYFERIGSIQHLATFQNVGEFLGEALDGILNFAPEEKHRLQPHGRTRKLQRWRQSCESLGNKFGEHYDEIDIRGRAHPSLGGASEKNH